MAHDISPSLVQAAALPNFAHLHALIALRKPIKLSRAVLRAVDQGHAPLQIVPRVTGALEKVGEQYRANHWAYFEDAFPKDFYEALLRQFPKRRYLEPPKSIFKSYDIGFKWERGKGGGAFLDRHPAYRALLEYFSSSEFGERMTLMSGSSVRLTSRAFLVTHSYPGSQVVPHMDDRIPAQYLPYINMIFFLDGTGGDRSGQLILANDNEYRDIVFEPPSIRNACLLYDTEAPFYHGFKPIAWGKYRRTLTISFAQEGYQPR